MPNSLSLSERCVAVAEDPPAISFVDEARRLLRISSGVAQPFEAFRTGARTRAVVATRLEVPHRLSKHQDRILVKLYKGPGTSAGSKQYQDYHQHWFHQFPSLTSNGHVQQSLEAGVKPGVGPYALLQYVEGEELAVFLDQGQITGNQARRIIQDILSEIWIPLWAAGLRFKDCHPGNFVVRLDGRVVMIDTEQMRKDLDERLQRPNDWTQRDKHERSGLSRLPGLLQRIILATDAQHRKTAVLREVKSTLTSVGLPELLRTLGRGGDVQACVDGVTDLLSEFRKKEWVS